MRRLIYRIPTVAFLAAIIVFGSLTVWIHMGSKSERCGCCCMGWTDENGVRHPGIGEQGLRSSRGYSR